MKTIDRASSALDYDERWYLGWHVPHHTASSTLKALSVALSMPPTEVKPVANRFAWMCASHTARPQNMQTALASLSHLMHFIVAGS